MRYLLVSLILVTANFLHAESPELLSKLEEAGFSPRANNEGELTAIYGFNPDGSLSPELWAVIQSSPELITINSSKMDGEDLRETARIQSLETLVIGGGGEAEESDYATLAALPNLKRLNLHHLKNFEGAKAFSNFEDAEKLEHLTIHNCRPFRGSALPEIAEIPNLKEIEFTALLIDMEDLAPLEGHPALESLILPVKPANMDAFLELATSLPQLKEISFLCPRGDFTRLDEPQFASLNAIPNLHRIRGINLGLTASQVEALVKEHPGMEIELRVKKESHGKSEPMEPLKE